MQLLSRLAPLTGVTPITPGIADWRDQGAAARPVAAGAGRGPAAGAPVPPAPGGPTLHAAEARHAAQPRAAGGRAGPPRAGHAAARGDAAHGGAGAQDGPPQLSLAWPAGGGPTPPWGCCLGRYSKVPTSRGIWGGPHHLDPQEEGGWDPHPRQNEGLPLRDFLRARGEVEPEKSRCSDPPQGNGDPENSTGILDESQKPMQL